MENKKGIFIVIEGIDGSGKSTLAKNLVQALNHKGNQVLLFTEPTNKETGQLIRKFLKKEISLSKTEVIEAFLADRDVSVEQNIYPNLQSGKTIVLDRYFYSMAAYQGDEEYSPEKILHLNQERNYPLPDILFFLNLSPEQALSRIQSRGESKERFESLPALTKIKENYEKILPDFTIRIDANKSEREILEACLSFIQF